MKVLVHHIYEYKKGLRNLVLHTMNTKDQELVENKLKNQGIEYLIQPVNRNKINVFFGAKECVDVVKEFGMIKLNELTPEQDFILGIMLGYDRMQQCSRYMKLLDNKIHSCGLKIVS